MSQVVNKFIQGAIPINKGGTGQTTASAALNALLPSQTGNTGYALVTNGTSASWSAMPGTVSAFFASSQVTTDSSTVSSTSFVTFSNSPAFTFTPSVTGTYKVYSSVPINAQLNVGTVRIFNTSGSATLLEESQAVGYSAVNTYDSIFAESTYTLTAGTSYQFDIQGFVAAGGNLICKGVAASFYMFAELIVSGASSSLPNVATITTDTTLTSANSYVLVNGSGAVAVTLPAASSGQVFNIKNISAFTTTITPTSGTIDGSASITLHVKYTSVDLVSDGTNWWIV